MDDAKTLGTVISLALLGWASFAWLAKYIIRQLMSGEMLTRREADGKDAEMLRLRESKDYAEEKLGEAVTALSKNNDALSALRRAAEERSP